MSLHKTLLAITLGATASFMWNYVSWGVLELHEPAMHEFADEDAVAEVIAANAPELGAYFLPLPDHSGEIDPVSEARQRERLIGGPRVTAFVRPGTGPGIDMRKTLLTSFGTQVVGAILIAIILSAVGTRVGYIRRVFLVGFVGAFTGVIGIYPNHTWWEFPLAYIKPYMIDTTAGWFVAGIFMAALIKPSTPGDEDEEELEPAPKRKRESKTAPKPVSKSESKSDSKSDSKAAPKLAPKPESKTAAPRPARKPESKPASPGISPAAPKPSPGLKVQPGGAPSLKSKSEPASPDAPKLMPRPKTDSDEKPPPPPLKPRSKDPD